MPAGGRPTRTSAAAAAHGPARRGAAASDEPGPACRCGSRARRRRRAPGRRLAGGTSRAARPARRLPAGTIRPLARPRATASSAPVASTTRNPPAEDTRTCRRAHDERHPDGGRQLPGRRRGPDPVVGLEDVGGGPALRWPWPGRRSGSWPADRWPWRSSWPGSAGRRPAGPARGGLHRREPAVALRPAARRRGPGRPGRWRWRRCRRPRPASGRRRERLVGRVGAGGDGLGLQGGGRPAGGTSSIPRTYSSKARSLTHGQGPTVAAHLDDAPVAAAARHA